jgi:hypothetical protein
MTTISKTLIGLTKAAREASDAAAADATRLGAELQRCVDRLETSKSELRRLVEFETADHVERILAGEDSRPKKPRRLKRIENLQHEIQGIELALPVAKGRASEAQRNATAASAAYNSSILPIVCDERLRAAAELRDAIAALTPLLVRLFAADMVQERFVGREFRFTGEVGDQFSGQIVATNLLRAIPERLRSPAIGKDVLIEAARGVAEEFIQQLQGA